MTDLALAYPMVGFTDKVKAVAALAMAVALFIGVGGPVLSPTDPMLAISMRTVPNAMLAVLTVIGLSALSALIGEALIGGKLPDFGLFAAAFGFAGLNLRSGNMASLLIDHGATDPAERGAFFLAMVPEVWFWLAAMLIGSGVGIWMAGRILPSAQGRLTDGTGPAGVRLPGLFSWLGESGAGDGAARRYEIQHGLLAAATTVVVATVIVSIAAAASPVAAVRTGQIYFALAAGFYIGSTVGIQVFKPAWCGWPYLAVGVLATIGYIMAKARPGIGGLSQPLARFAERYEALPGIPPGTLSRATPVEYAAVGLAAAVAGCWFARRSIRGRLEGAG
jgi:hypothetical protein